MIRSFRHKGLQRFFETVSKAGIQPAHASKLRLQLAKLDSASSADDMNMPGWRLHSLKGETVRSLGGLGQRELAADLPI